MSKYDDVEAFDGCVGGVDYCFAVRLTCYYQQWGLDGLYTVGWPRVDARGGYPTEQ